MNLLIIRHAIAEEREDFAKTGQSDDLRPLTPDGRAKMARGAAGLHTIVPEISYLVSSPLVRARQTADIVAGEFGIGVNAETDALAPDAPYDAFVRWLERHARQRLVAAVGHEPHLSGLVTWLMCGADDPCIELKKGAACLLRFDGKPKRGSGMLCWALTPGHLRGLTE